MKELTEEEYKRNLFIKERQYEKNIEINQIWETFANVLRDILQSYVSKYRRTNLPHKPIENPNEWISVETFFNNQVNSNLWEDHSNNKQPLCRIGNNRMYYNPSDVYIPIQQNIDTVYKEIKTIETYCNKEFEKVSIAYKLTVPLISISDDNIFAKKY